MKQISAAVFPLLVAIAVAASASANAGASPFVLAFTNDRDPQSYANLQAFRANVNAVALGSAYAIRADGSIDASGVTVNTNHVVAYAKNQKLALYGSVSDFNNATQNWDTAIFQTIEKTPTSRDHAVASLVDLAVSNGFTGIDLDLEMIGQESGGPLVSDRVNHTAFVTALASALHARGLQLILSVPGSDGTVNFAYFDGYDYAALGAVSDYVQVMTYNEVGPGWSTSPAGSWPGPCSGLDWMTNIMTYMVSVMPSSKILLGLPAYGYDFSTGKFQTWAADKAYGTVGFNAYIASKKGTVALDAVSYAPNATWGHVVQQWGTFSTAKAQPVFWFDNPASISAKAALVPRFHLGGTSIWAMGYEDGYFWRAHNAGLAGGDPGNIAPIGTGHAWIGMNGPAGNVGQTANAAINDGNNAVSVVLDPNGEGGSATWEAAGVTWSSAHTIASVTFSNGAVDANGNGYFHAGLSMQYTTNGTTWVQSNWTATPAYPNSSAAARKTYTFKGTTLGAVRGVRVAGQTGGFSASGSVTEVRAVGK